MKIGTFKYLTNNIKLFLEHKNESESAIYIYF